MGKNILKILMPLVLFATSLTQADSKESDIFSFAIHGGGGCQSTQWEFYKELVLFDKKMQNLGVPPDKRLSLFGIEKDGKHILCLAGKRLKDEGAGKLETSLNEFGKTDPDRQCSLVKPMLKLALAKPPISSSASEEELAKHDESIFGHPLKNLDGKGSMVSGPSTSQKVEENFRNLTTAMKPGNHIYLNLDDHGAVFDNQMPKELWTDSEVKYLPNKKEWIVGLGSEHQTLSVTQLANYLKPLVKNGVVVHVDVNACYSGGFNELTSILGGHVCVTATSDKERPALGNTTIMTSEDSQLHSFACAKAVAVLDKPTSSLDEIVDNWAIRNTVNEMEYSACTTSFQEFSVIANSLKSLSKSNKDDLRNKLITLFQNDFLAPYKECLDDQKVEKTKGSIANTPEQNPSIRFYTKASECVKDGKVSLTPLESYFIKSELHDWLSPPEHYVKMPGKELSKYISFLSKADSASLETFKSAICCLGFNPKTRKYPAVCDQ